MRILFITDNFPPEVNAPASRTFEHAKEWVARGVDVTIITGNPNYPQGKLYPGHKNKLYQKETISNIKVIRVWTFIAPNSGVFKRTFDFISFGLSSFIAGLFVKTDIIIATSPQLFSAVSGMALGFVKRRPWIMEVRDLWPESIITLGAMKSKLIIKTFEAIELRLYRSAKKIIVVTDSFKKNIIEKNIDETKIEVFKNGVNTEMFKPEPKNKEILDRLGLNSQTIVGYIGTHGMSHNLEFIIRAIAKLKVKDIAFVFIGDGAVKNDVVTLANQLNLTNVIFHPPVAKELIKDYLSVIDISLVPLKRTETFKTVIPSKIFEATAMRKPILLGVEGESKALIEEYNAGIAFTPDDEIDFEEKLNEIIKKKDSYNSGLDKLSHDFNRNRIANEMLDSIKDLIN